MMHSFNSIIYEWGKSGAQMPPGCILACRGRPFRRAHLILNETTIITIGILKAWRFPDIVQLKQSSDVFISAYSDDRTPDSRNDPTSTCCFLSPALGLIIGFEELDSLRALCCTMDAFMMACWKTSTQEKGLKVSFRLSHEPRGRNQTWIHQKGGDEGFESMTHLLLMAEGVGLGSFPFSSLTLVSVQQWSAPAPF